METGSAMAVPIVEMAPTVQIVTKSGIVQDVKIVFRMRQTFVPAVIHAIAVQPFVTSAEKNVPNVQNGSVITAAGVWIVQEIPITANIVISVLNVREDMCAIVRKDAPIVRIFVKYVVKNALAAQNTVCWMVHGKNTSVKSAEAALMIVTNAMFADCV